MSRVLHVEFVGVDWWERAVFRTAGGRWLKTEILIPDFPNRHPKDWSEDVRSAMLRGLYTTDEFDGELGFPLPEDVEVVCDWKLAPQAADA